MNIRKIALMSCIVLAPISALAQDSPSSKAFEEAHKKMMGAMSMQMSGNPDMDFAMMMIPHHQGAIDMAKIELQYGKDPELRAMAEKIIAAQEEEIAQFRQWTEKHGH